MLYVITATYVYKIMLEWSSRKSRFLDTSHRQYPWFLKRKGGKKWARVNNVTKRGTVDARNGGAPYAF